MSNEIESYSDLKKALGASEDNSLLLGNGFNMSIGIDTSYKKLFEHIQENGDDDVKIALKNYEKEIVGNRFCIEAVIDQITPLKSNNALLMRVKKFLANFSKMNSSAEKEREGINKSTQDRIRRGLYKEVVRLTSGAPKKVEKENFRDFLSFFQKYFTINYDPTLYRLLNLFRNDSKQGESSQEENEGQPRESRFSEEERKQISESLDTDPWQKLHGNTKNSIRRQIGEDPLAQESATNDSSEPPQDRLNTVLDDGFRHSDSNEELIWGESPEMNVFYLHGAMHIYEENENFYKISSRKSSLKLTEEILEQYSEDVEKSSTCVFQATADEKEEVMQSSRYLEHCLKGLQSMTGNLVIIGWSCFDCDDHLIKAIRESDVENIYISYYSGEGSSPDEDQQRFEKAFGRKNVLPFDSEILSDTLKRSSG